MSQFIRDLSTLGFSIALCAITVLALAVSCMTLASLALVSMPLVLLATPTLITALCLYSVYQCMYPSVPSVVHGPLCEDDLVIVECATWAEYHAQFSHHDTTPVCSITYALLATTGTTDETYLAPAYVATLSPVTITSEDIDNAISEGSISPMDTEPTLRSTCNLEHYSHDALVSLAKELKIKGANSRWTDATLIRKITEATAITVAA